jgi:hypothetical protein
VNGKIGITWRPDCGGQFGHAFTMSSVPMPWQSRVIDPGYPFKTTIKRFCHAPGNERFLKIELIHPSPGASGMSVPVGKAR